MQRPEESCEVLLFVEGTPSGGDRDELAGLLHCQNLKGTQLCRK
jgi:hypothetical protein